MAARSLSTRSGSPTEREPVSKVESILRRVPYLLLFGVTVFIVTRILLGPAFQVRTIDVVGSRLLTADTVRAAAGVVGQNEFTLRRSAIERNVLALSVPQSVSIQAILPNRLTIRIIEQQPSYIWKVDPTLYLVSADGIVLGTTTTESQRVILVDDDGVPVKVGDKVSLDALREASSLLSMLPRVIGQKPHYLEYSQRLGIILPTYRGLRIAFGRNQDLADKLLELPSVVQAALAAQPPAHLIDLGYVGHPYYR